MNLTTFCSNCRQKDILPHDEASRPYLADEVGGEEFDHRCSECGVVEKKHVNEVRAEISMNPIYIAVAVSIVATIALWRFGFVAMVSFILPFLLYYQQMDSVKAFNAYKISRY